MPWSLRIWSRRDPAYNGMAMGCGLEDKGLTEKAYLAMEYGWEEALERYEEDFPIWEELEPETVTRCCDRHDVPGNVLFEGDVYRNPDNLLFEICYGKYMAFCRQIRHGWKVSASLQSPGM